MLVKLLKHEWKDTYKVGLLMLGALAIVTLIGALGALMPALMSGDNLQSGADDAGVVMGAISAMFISMASFWVYTMAIMGIVYGMLIYHGIRMYKTMYSDEGYLTHTLPVTPHQLIISKVLNAGIWNGLVSVGMSLSIVVFMIVMFSSMGVMLPEEANFQAVWSEMFTQLGVTWLDIVHMIISTILAMVIGPFTSMMTLFVSFAIGQLAPKFKAVLGVGVYFAIASVQSMIAFGLGMVFSLGSTIVASVTNSMPSVTSNTDASLVISLIMLVGGYFVSRTIITKKLNLS